MILYLEKKAIIRTLSLSLKCHSSVRYRKLASGDVPWAKCHQWKVKEQHRTHQWQRKSLERRIMSIFWFSLSFFFFLPFLTSHKMAARDTLCCQPSLFLLPPRYPRPVIILHLLCLWREKPTLQTMTLAAVFFLQFVKISSQIKRIWAKHATAIWIYMKEKPSTPPYLGWWMYLMLQNSFLVPSWPQDQN